MFCAKCGKVIPENSVCPCEQQQYQQQPQQQFQYYQPDQQQQQQLRGQQEYEYHVLTMKDKWFSGKFDPQKLQDALNAYAQQGWRLNSCATADIPGFGTARQEFIAVLERKVQ